jgi:hypothetical protein
LTYFQGRQRKHEHRFFLDANTQEEFCTCGHVKGSRSGSANKYRAQSCFYGGYWYASTAEANHAAELDLLLRSKKIKAWERQYIVHIEAEGKHILDHKIDFRVHQLDDSYTLEEVKGVETADWKMRRKLLELFWLPKHPDHTYHVFR